MGTPRNGHRSCREIILSLLDDDEAHRQEELFDACSHWSPATFMNTLSGLISEGAIVRTVTVTFQTAANRRKSNG